VVGALRFTHPTQYAGTGFLYTGCTTMRTEAEDSAMRLSARDQQAIHAIVEQEFGAKATVRLFGSRLHDELRGGDVDLLVELPDPVADPAVVAAELAVKITRALDGRQVDVILRAPNLRHLPIHDIAARDGVVL